MKKFALTLFVLLSFVSLSATASSINLYINQIDGIQEDEYETTISFQDAVLESLFEAGCIVTSENVSLSEDSQYEESKILKNSKAGFFNYLVIMKVYVDSSTKEITEVSYKIKNVKTDADISDGKIKAERTYSLAEKNAVHLGKELGKKIYSEIGNW